MAKKFQQTKSDDALTIHIAGDVRNPEPGSCIIKFPGGQVEVTRCTDNTYWAHLSVVDPSNIVDSRVDHTFEAHRALGKIPDFPRADAVQHIALRVANNVRHFDPDA